MLQISYIACYRFESAGVPVAKEKRRSSIVIPGASIYKKGSIQDLKGNSCRLYLNYHVTTVDKNGAETKKRKQKTRTYRIAASKKLTRGEAIEELYRWARELEGKEVSADSEGTTVTQYMRSYIDEKTGSIERRTASDYEEILKNRIGPLIGDRHIGDLDGAAVQDWVNALSERYAPTTVRKALVLLRSAMQLAVERDILAKDPTRSVSAPKLEQKNPNSLDEDGIACAVRIINANPSKAENVGYALALYLALRAEEICGLRWRHVDLKRKTLRIEVVLGRAEGPARWYLKMPKNKASRRLLDIPDVLIEPLESRLKKAKEDAASFGLDYRDYFVVGHADGSFMTSELLSRNWSTLSKNSQLIGLQGKYATLHDLRHTWATQAVLNNMDIKTISAILGHSNAAMTLNIYASSDPRAKKKATAEMADIIVGLGVEPNTNARAKTAKDVSDLIARLGRASH